VGVTWDLCFQVALRENAKAQEEALERLRVQATSEKAHL
jgi:hypothetical protein